MDLEPPQTPVHLCHFVCNECKTVFPLEEHIYLAQGFSLLCPSCQHVFSVRNLMHENGIEVLELFGCTYAGRILNPELLRNKMSDHFKASGQLKVSVGAWIDDALLQTQPKMDETVILSASPEETSFFDELKHNWIVEDTKNQRIEFDSFTALRQEIVKGNIDQKASIINPSGEKTLLSQYPGTADLFGNANQTSQAKDRSLDPNLQPAMPSQKAEVLKKLKQGFFILTFASLLASVPYLWKKILDIQTQRIVADLTQAISPSKSKPNIDAWAQKLMQYQVQNLPSIKQPCLEMLARDSKNTSALGCLASCLTEEFYFQKNSDALSTAKTIIRYLNAHHDQEESTFFAAALHLWREDKPQKAIDLIKNKPFQEETEQLLLADIFAHLDDTTQTSLILSELLISNPKNTSALKRMVTLFKKQEKYQGAITYQEKVLQTSKNSKEEQQTMLSLYRKAKDLDGLVNFLKNISVSSQANDEMHYELIRTLAELNIHSATASHAEKFFELYPQSPFSKEVAVLYDRALNQANSGQNASQATGDPSNSPAPKMELRPRRRR